MVLPDNKRTYNTTNGDLYFKNLDKDNFTVVAQTNAKKREDIKKQ